MRSIRKVSYTGAGIGMMITGVVVIINTLSDFSRAGTLVTGIFFSVAGIAIAIAAQWLRG